MKTFNFGLIFSFIISSILSAQVGYVPVDDEIYHFLDRMNTNNVIEDYNSFKLPKKRSSIKRYLKQIVKNQSRLDQIDQSKLEDFLKEFEVDLKNSDNNISSLYADKSLTYLINEREKYLYHYIDDKGNSFFFNFVGKLDFLMNSDIESNSNTNALLYRFGGEIRGSLFNRIGFEINTINGSFSGNKNLAQNYSSLRYNYKFHRESEDNSGDNFFDETSAFLALDFDYATLKIGNDRKLIGHGPTKFLLSDNAPRMDYISLDLNYKVFSFSFFHGKLLGTPKELSDPIQGGINVVSDKYIAYHRLGLNFSKHLQLGLGEMIVYANRNIDFSYLNPFAFYKSAEHANQDRDNSFLFFDIQNNSINGIKFYSTILIDDIDFGKIGTGWYGNQTLLNIGTYISKLYKTFPLDFEISYVKIDPYVFSHRLYDNNFTNLNYNLGSTLQPNSSSVEFNLYFRPHHRLNLNAGFTYTLHGENEINPDGSIAKNYGGNILLGHRPFDSEEIYFLDGILEISRTFKLLSSYEPIKNWIFSIGMTYNNNSLAKSQQSEEFFTKFSLYSKF